MINQRGPTDPRDRTLPALIVEMAARAAPAPDNTPKEIDSPMTFQFKADTFQADRAYPIPAAFVPDTAIQWEQLCPNFRHVSHGIPACLLTDNGPCLSRTEVVIAIDPDTRLVVAFDCNASRPTRQIATGARP